MKFSNDNTKFCDLRVNQRNYTALQSKMAVVVKNLRRQWTACANVSPVEKQKKGENDLFKYAYGKEHNHFRKVSVSFFSLYWLISKLKL